MGKLKTAVNILFHAPLKIIPALGINGFLNFVPDALYLKLIFKAEMGYSLNIKKPETFNEKQQWLKIHDRKRAYVSLADKIAVRDYISKRIGDDYLIPIIGKWKKAEDIDFDELPNAFVLKCNHDSNSVIICRDKANFDFENARKKLKMHLRKNAYYGGREWPYKYIKRYIIAEQYMVDDTQPALTDYKFFCFNGKAKFLYVSTGLEHHETASISFFDLDWNRLPFRRLDYKEYEGELLKPKHFEHMKQLADFFAEDIKTPFVRVDLYEINDRVYFSEFTFTPCCGMIPFYPREWDGKIGEMLELPQKT